MNIHETKNPRNVGFFILEKIILRITIAFIESFLKLREGKGKICPA